MQSMSPDEARQFAARWLPAWTGNNPLKLASFYTDDLFYSDPTLPDGVSGKEAFIRYLSKLPANNPDWMWTRESAIPLQDGFLNKLRLGAIHDPRPEPVVRIQLSLARSQANSGVVMTRPHWQGPPPDCGNFSARVGLTV
jgi:hypothetical protein